VGPPQYPSASGPTQQHSCHYRERLCLLKGCERAFRPGQPHQHFCSPACQKEAARWRRWRSCQGYRASEQGKKQRRQQSRRYRERCRQQRAARWEEELLAIESQVAQEAAAAQAQSAEVAQLEPEPPREGQRLAPNPQNFPWTPCRRPGCYVLFPMRPSVPQQRFCCCLCRRALRRVLDREARWRERRRRPHRPAQRSRPPPPL
jgi:hypothetical protein